MNRGLISQLAFSSKTKILMIIMDGLGGLARTPSGKTELETANTPNLDSLASLSSLGLTVPVRPGITTGSGPGHLAIFGYDPIENEIGRGALEALGVDFDLHPEDIAVRGNFCSVDQDGRITDRRAGRIPTYTAMALAELLSNIKIDGIEFFVLPVKEHRFAFIIRGHGLGDKVDDTDPLMIGESPIQPCGQGPESELTAEITRKFIDQSKILLSKHSPANMILLRGFAKLPKILTFQELYALNPAAIAVNGMYRGVARLVGMEILDVNGKTIADEFQTLQNNWDKFDFFYLHIKQTDTFGEDGDFDGKVKVIEEVDSYIPEVLALNPDVVIISGDHSSPAVMRSHSWHPVPSLLFSKYVRADQIPNFSERTCANGSLGLIQAKEIMPLVLANALRLNKFGA